MNLELDEEYGAGFEGTKELLYKYLKDTPGQKIVKYMDKTNTELEESITADTVEKITGAQIEKYIDGQNFKVLDQISKFLTKDEYELWSKNGFEGRTFELLMKQRAKNVKESSEELHEMQELYAVVDENDVVLATASNELAAKRSISTSELPPLSVKDKSKLRIVKTRKQAEVDKPLKEHATPTLEEVRLMKIISLATGCTDSEALYEYALTAPTYSSLVELKENFNRYIQDT